MIVNHESGDHQHHQSFSKHLIRQLQPAKISNPVQKVTVEVPAAYGKDPIQMCEKINNHYTEEQFVNKVIHRNLTKPTTSRDLANYVYVGYKGAPRIAVQKQIDQSEPYLTQWNKPVADTPTAKAVTPSRSGENHTPSKKLNMSERQHHDIFGRSSGKKDYGYSAPANKAMGGFGSHPARQSNFNIFGGF